MPIMIESVLLWLQDPFLGKTTGTWLGFFIIILTLMVLDLGILNRKSHEISVRKSLILTSFYILVAFAFGVWVWLDYGPDVGLVFFTAYLVEESLSIDNIFVMSLVFTSFAIPPQYQHRVLFWGIIGVIIMRGIMIGLGTAIVSEFQWVLYLFGAFLLFTGIKMAFSKTETASDPSQSKMVQFFKRFLPVTPFLHKQAFFIQGTSDTGKRIIQATPLFLALMTIEFTDVIFALDSVPAVLAITTDPFLVYTSNIFAILGLRSLYFALSAMTNRFEYLKYALSAVLVFIGAKIFWTELVGHIPSAVSLGVTFFLLATGIIASLLKPQKK